MAKKAANCLNPTLLKLYKKTLELEGLNEKVRKHLPQEVKQHCFIRTFNQGVLNLDTPNPEIAYLLRFEIPSLIQKLRIEEKIYGLITINIHVNPQAMISSNLIKAKESENKTAKTRPENLEQALSQLEKTLKGIKD